MRWIRRLTTRCFGDAGLRRAGSTLAAVVVLASGCSAGGSAEEQSELPAGPATAEESATGGDTSGPANPTPESTESVTTAEPVLSDVDALADHLGIYVHADNEEFYLAQEARKQRQVERDQMIASCMSDRGFDFVPDDPEVIHGYHDGFAEQRNTPDWASRYGFGVTTLLWPQDVLGDDAVGFPGGAPAVPSPGDPLGVYLETLDDPDRYWTALFGAEPDPDTGAYASTSCAGVAARAVPDPGSESAIMAEQLVDEDSGDPSTVILERLANDERVLARQQSGSECLAAAELGVTDELDARVAVWERRGQLPELDPADTPATMEPDARRTYLSALAELQAFEVSLAEAVWECQVAQPQINRLKVSILADMLG